MESTRLFQGPFFQLHYPQSWECEIIENIPAFFDPEANWALQIAATHSPEGQPFHLLTEMHLYLEKNGLEFKRQQVSTYLNRHKWECAACEFIKEERFWLVHLLVHKNRMLFVIFNSDDIPDDPLARLISLLITSIELTIES